MEEAFVISLVPEFPRFFEFSMKLLFFSDHHCDQQETVSELFSRGICSFLQSQGLLRVDDLSPGPLQRSGATLLF